MEVDLLEMLPIQNELPEILEIIRNFVQTRTREKNVNCMRLRNNYTTLC